jgi:GTP-binding protein
MVLADIPGLIEGASEGKGLGHRFLRHVERARVMLVLLDLGGWGGVAPQEQLDALLGELGDYRPELLERPRLVVGSRADMANDHDFDGMQTSSVTGEGLPEVLGSLATMVRRARLEIPESQAITIHRPVGDEVQIERFGDGSWNVLGRAPRRAVALSDLTDAQAVEYARDRLQQLGVNAALVRAGVRFGDDVHIGDFTFEYEED